MAKGEQDDPIYYAFTNTPSSGTQEVRQVSGTVHSTNIISAITLDTIQVSGAVDSVNVIGTVPVSIANTLDTKQVSGAVWSVFVESQAFAFDVKQVSGSIDSVSVIGTPTVSVTDIFGSLAANLINPDGRLKVEQPSGSSGLTDTELRASRVYTEQVSGANWSMSVVDIFGSLSANVVNPDGRVKVELPSGASGLTDTELRASHLDVQQVSGATDSSNVASWIGSTAPTVGQKTMANSIPVTMSSDQGSIPVSVAAPSSTFRGRINTFRTPGRAGTVGQKIFALHNATGSTKVVRINQITVDLAMTVVKAVTVLPPIIRIHRFTAIPTNGTALTKVAKDTALTSNASITVWGDASADGTGSGTTLTVTIPASNMLTQEFAPRFITAAGYEMFDRTEMLVGQDIVLRALEGIVVFLDYVLATQNPTTDMWIVVCDWYEV